MSNNPLGQQTKFPKAIDRSLLYPIAREHSMAKDSLFTTGQLYGYDRWTCYEVSWLNLNHLPQQAILQFEVPCSSKFILESKSLKLYLGSLNNEIFNSWNALLEEIKGTFESSIPLTKIKLISLEDWHRYYWRYPNGKPLESKSVAPHDTIASVATKDQMYNSNNFEEYYTNLFRSLCPVTGQPDWATVEIKHLGPKLNKSEILRYLLSFREHQAFHETCCEQLLEHLVVKTKSIEMMIRCNFLRRGGIAISPIRSNKPIPECNNSSRVLAQQ